MNWKTRLTIIPDYYRRFWSTLVFLVGMAVLIYHISSFWWLALYFIGAFIYIEHVYQWGFQFFDFFGHEWFGFIFMVLASIFNGAWWALLCFVISVLISIDFDKEKQTWNFLPWRKNG